MATNFPKFVKARELTAGDFIKFEDVTGLTCTVVKISANGNILCISKVNSGFLVLASNDKIIEVLGKKRVSMDMLRIVNAMERKLNIGQI